jgi:hemolysin III
MRRDPVRAIRDDRRAAHPVACMDVGLKFPVFSSGEQAVDRAIHIVGVAAAAPAIPFLVVLAAGQSSIALGGVLTYGLGTIAMLVVSALYHVTPPSRRKELLRRIDHAAIFVMIAGTCTPFVLCRIDGVWGLGLLAYVWLIAIGGVAMKLRFPRRFEGVAIVLYLALGWSVLVMLAALSATALALLGSGVAFYSVGVVFYLSRRLRYHNAIWHGFVLAGV